ncbi:hypothetical protein K440DRAFT_636236 [Wilcoxina mikolae CBS 423.85]|nr:hypothetical protein K440DRAFT_636236 [Wilcoxina mikolae CBS 423.85]
MKVNYLFIVAAILPAYSHGQGIINILNDNGFTNFATALEHDPDLLYKVTYREDVTVWAAINEATGFLPVNDTKRKLFRRDDPPSPTLDNSFSYPEAKKGKRNVHGKYRGPLPDSNFQVLNTFLRDPDYVNLGPDQPGRIVTNYAAPKPGTSESVIKVRGGLEIVHTVSGPFKYDKGVIYGVNEFVALPRPLLESLSLLGFTTFIDVITSSGVKQQLSQTPAMTIFTFANPSNATSVNININEYTITGYLGTSPELVGQMSLQNDAGATLHFKYHGGFLYVNGCRVVRSDILIKNGVLHQLEHRVQYL